VSGNHSVLERFIDAQSPLHALDPRVKLLLLLTVVVALALLPFGQWAALAAFALLIWTAILRAGIGLAETLKRSLVALPFALVAVSLVISRPGTPLFSIALGPIQLTGTAEGLIAFISVLIKSWLSVQAVLLLMAVTHFADVLRALRELRLPAVLVAILGFSYRYLFVMVDEAQRMLRARESRSAAASGRSSGGSIGWRAAVVGRMVGTLFIRAYERSERIYVAMLSRGYQGEPLALTARPLSARERGIVIFAAALCALLVWMSYVVSSGALA
jgi:cobalt/nickel transport system permease protein